MKTFRALFLVSALVAGIVYAASASITVATTNGAQAGSGSVCTAAGALGATKTVDFQCDGYKVYMRPACATDSAGCKLDAGYGDRIYDFKSVSNTNRRAPVQFTLRTTESRLCFRNVDQPADAATADAGDAFSCMVNEYAPF